MQQSEVDSKIKREKKKEKKRERNKILATMRKEQN